MLTDTKQFTYLGVMNTKTKENQAPGAMSQQQFKDALETDLGMLAALINFIRSTPRAMDALAEIAYHSNENRLQVQDAIEKLKVEHES